MIDTNLIIRTYLVTPGTPLFGLVGARIYVPRLPENTTLPAIGFLTRGGTASPYIPELPNPSVQFDCWANNPITARAVYRALYDRLQGIQRTPVVIGADTYYIMSAIEEVQGQDLADVDIPGLHRVLTFFSIMVR